MFVPVIMFYSTGHPGIQESCFSCRKFCPSITSDCFPGSCQSNPGGTSRCPYSHSYATTCYDTNAEDCPGNHNPDNVGEDCSSCTHRNHCDTRRSTSKCGNHYPATASPTSRSSIHVGFSSTNPSPILCWLVSENSPVNQEQNHFYLSIKHNKQ